jgi:hypothetical protein
MLFQHNPVLTDKKIRNYNNNNFRWLGIITNSKIVLCSPGLQPGGAVAASDRKLHSTNRSQNCLAQFRGLELWIAQCLSTSRAPENRNGGISDLRQKGLVLEDHYLIIAQFNRFQHNKHGEMNIGLHGQ